mgnify:FL=1
MKKTNKFMGLSVLTIIMLVILDQLTKFQAVVKLKNGSPFVIIDGVFELRYLENQSAAFGFDIVSFFQKIFKIKYFTENPEAFLTAKMVIFAIVTIAVVILLMIFYSHIPQTKRFLGINLILIFFVAGAIGNLIDRIVNNYVVDFFYFKLINFPIFNVADIYVTVAAFAFIILGIFYYKEEDFEMIFKKKDKK